MENIIFNELIARGYQVDVGLLRSLNQEKRENSGKNSWKWTS